MLVRNIQIPHESVFISIHNKFIHKNIQYIMKTPNYHTSISAISRHKIPNLSRRQIKNMQTHHVSVTNIEGE